jgi:hypothetical protein
MTGTEFSDLQLRPVTSLPCETILYVRQALECVAASQPYSEYGWN